MNYSINTHTPRAIFSVLFLFLSLFSSLNAQECDVTRTANNGPAQLCLGDVADIMLFECVDWQNVTYEWTVEKCFFDPSTLTTDCNNVTILTPTPISTTLPSLNYTCNETGVLQFKVNVRDNVSGQIIATPCTGGPLCLTASVEIFGTKVPDFTITETSCNYDPIRDEYSKTIEITPTINADLSGLLIGVNLTVDWGDGQSNQRIISGANSRTFSHTYTWSMSANPSPSFPILVTAKNEISVFEMDHCNTLESFTLSYEPSVILTDLTYEIVESNCDQQILCFSDLSEFIALRVYNEQGELIDQFDPSTSPCITFTENGNYTFQLVDIQSVCPYFYYIEITLSPEEAGELTTTSTSISPGDPFHLNLTNPHNGFVSYELWVNDCGGASYWLPLEMGPADQFNTYQVPSWITEQLTPCMLNENFEFCFRTKVFCEEVDISYLDNNTGTASNIICLPICVGGDGNPGGGGGDDPNDPGHWLQGQQDDTHSIQERTQKASASTTVYPNPSKGIVNIEMPANETGTLANLEIVNILGQVVWQEEVDESQNTSLTLDLSKHSSGTYFVRLLSDNGTTHLSTIVITK
jgi:hypothetical protein